MRLLKAGISPYTQGGEVEELEITMTNVGLRISAGLLQIDEQLYIMSLYCNAGNGIIGILLWSQNGNNLFSRVNVGQFVELPEIGNHNTPYSIYVDRRLVERGTGEPVSHLANNPEICQYSISSPPRDRLSGKELQCYPVRLSAAKPNDWKVICWIAVSQEPDPEFVYFE